MEKKRILAFMANQGRKHSIRGESLRRTYMPRKIKSEAKEKK